MDKFKWLKDYWSKDIEGLKHHTFQIEDILIAFPSVESTGYTNRKYQQWHTWYWSDELDRQLARLQSISFGNKPKIVSGKEAELCLISLEISTTNGVINAKLNSRAAIVNGALLLDLHILAMKLFHLGYKLGQLEVSIESPCWHFQAVGHLLKLDRNLFKFLVYKHPAIGKQVWLSFQPEYWLKSGHQWVTFNTINKLPRRTSIIY